MTKHADPKPPFCASCYGFDSEWRFIDFEAAYDGAVIPGSPANLPVDDLIICENCLAEAFALLDPDGLHRELKRLQDRIDYLEDDNAAKDRMVGRMQTTTTELIDHPVSKQRGRHVPAGVPEDVRDEIVRNRAKRKKVKVGQ